VAASSGQTTCVGSAFHIEGPAKAKACSSIFIISRSSGLMILTIRDPNASLWRMDTAVFQSFQISRTYIYWYTVYNDAQFELIRPAICSWSRRYNILPLSDIGRTAV